MLGLILAGLLFAIRHNLPVSWCEGVGFLLTATIVGYSVSLYQMVLKKQCGGIILGTDGSGGRKKDAQKEENQRIFPRSQSCKVFTYPKLDYAISFCIQII